MQVRTYLSNRCATLLDQSTSRGLERGPTDQQSLPGEPDGRTSMPIKQELEMWLGASLSPFAPCDSLNSTCTSTRTNTQGKQLPCQHATPHTFKEGTNPLILADTTHIPRTSLALWTASYLACAPTRALCTLGHALEWSLAPAPQDAALPPGPAGRHPWRTTPSPGTDARS